MPSEVQVSEDNIVYALQVLDAIGEGFDRVASKPELLNKFSAELMKSFPDILDALLMIVRPDCRLVVMDLGRKSINMVNQCRKTQK